MSPSLKSRQLGSTALVVALRVSSAMLLVLLVEVLVSTPLNLRRP